MSPRWSNALLLPNRFVRVGQSAKIHPSLQSMNANGLGRGTDFPFSTDLEKGKWIGRRQISSNGISSRAFLQGMLPLSRQLWVPVDWHTCQFPTPPMPDHRLINNPPPRYRMQPCQKRCAFHAMVGGNTQRQTEGKTQTCVQTQVYQGRRCDGWAELSRQICGDVSG